MRQQYGLRHFAELGLAVYALLSIAHMYVEDLGMAMFVARKRAVSRPVRTTSLALRKGCLFHLLWLTFPLCGRNI